MNDSLLTEPDLDRDRLRHAIQDPQAQRRCGTGIAGLRCRHYRAHYRAGGDGGADDRKGAAAHPGLYRGTPGQRICSTR